MAKKQVTLCCPDCGTVLTLEYGLFSATGICPKCKRKINVKQESVQTVICEGCRNEVVYDARKGDQQPCPVCGKNLKSLVMQKRFDQVQCPNCGTRNDVKLTDGNCTCGVCGFSFSVKQQKMKDEIPENNEGMLIKAPQNEDFIIWHHPVNRFSYSSQLIVPEGMTALLLRNGQCNAPVRPGNYTLSDSKLRLKDEMTEIMGGADRPLTMDVYFVRDRFEKPLRWGGEIGTVDNEYGEVAGKVCGRGEISLRIVNALNFARSFGFRTITENELTWIQETEPFKEAELVTRIRKMACDGVLSIVRIIREKNLWPMEQLNIHRPDIQKEAQEEIDEQLITNGFRSDFFSIEAIFIKEDPEEEKRRINRQKILSYIEQQKKWRTVPMTVHMKDRAALFAEVTLEGDYGLKISDRIAFFKRYEIMEWVRNGVSNEEVTSFCNRMVNELAKNVFADVLQPMIDNYDVDVRELNRYFRFLRDTVQGSLNSKMEGYGLQVEYFSMGSGNVIPSPALAQLSTLASHKEESQIAQEMREFNQQMDLKRTDGDAQTIVKKTEIEVNRDLKLDSILQQKEMLTNQQEIRQLEFEKAHLERQRELDQLKKSWERSDYQKETAFVHQQATDELRRQNELNALVQNNQLQVKLRSAEEIRAEWELQKQLENEQLEAELKRQEAGHSSAIRQQRETNNLLEEMERQEEDREERRKTAEFQREMQKQETQVLREMEQLKLQYDQAAKAAEMEERLFSQQVEIEKLRLTLNNYEALGRQDANVKIASVNADALRALAEKEYETTKAQKDREEAERREKELAAQENQFRDQAERLLTKMWEIQGVLDQMKVQTEHKKAEGQALSDLVQAQNNQQNASALVEALEKMAGSKGGVLKKEDGEQKQNQGQPDVSGWSPMPALRVCPKCGKTVPQFASLCQCGQYLG